MFRFPHKKSQLGQANNILKVAASLVKVRDLSSMLYCTDRTVHQLPGCSRSCVSQELDAPRTISGLSMSPLLFNITRVVVVSAFSSVLSDLLGFKLCVLCCSRRQPCPTALVTLDNLPDVQTHARAATRVFRAGAWR